MDKRKKRARRRLRKAIDGLYSDPDRQEEFVDIICEAYLAELTRDERSSGPNSS